MEQGLSEEKIARLAAYRDEASFTARERLALEYAELMALDHTAIGDDFFRRVREEFTFEAQARHYRKLFAELVGVSTAAAATGRGDATAGGNDGPDPHRSRRAGPCRYVCTTVAGANVARATVAAAGAS